MYKILIYNDKEYKFKASGATKILYKRLFGSSPDDFFMSRSETMTDPITRKNVETVQKNKGIGPEANAAALELMKNKDYVNSTLAYYDFAQQYAYITYLEANFEPAKINEELTVDKFVVWLMNFDESFFRENATEFQKLYQTNIKPEAEAKNAGA